MNDNRMRKFVHMCSFPSSSDSIWAKVKKLRDYLVNQGTKVNFVLYLTSKNLLMLTMFSPMLGYG